jgi:hypothetical protein
MKITMEDALSLLGKYVDERTPVLAVFVTPSVSIARVTGLIHISVLDVVGPHLIVGKDDGTSDQIKFRLLDCEFSYGDFRDAIAEDFGADKFEGFLVVGSSRGDTLSLFEMKRWAAAPSSLVMGTLNSRLQEVQVPNCRDGPEPFEHSQSALFHASPWELSFLPRGHRP